MDERILAIFGSNFSFNKSSVIIEPLHQIEIFKFKNNVELLVYGHLYYSLPCDIIKIKLDKKAELFSKEQNIIEYVITGIPHKELNKQLEIYNISKIQLKFGDKIKQKINEFESQIKLTGQAKINVPDNFISIIKNYAKNNKYTVESHATGELIILKN